MGDKVFSMPAMASKYVLRSTAVSIARQLVDEVGIEVE